eukprot:3382140-Rhodomonas_salina.1
MFEGVRAHVRGGHLEESEVMLEGGKWRSRMWTTRSRGSHSRGSRGGVGGGHVEESEVDDDVTGLTLEGVTWRSRRLTTRSRGSRSRGSCGRVRGGRRGHGDGAHVRGGHVEESEVDDEVTGLMCKGATRKSRR